MSTNFEKVNLGFAEFVSQLIHETFDAILDSQNYQLVKYKELETSLNISDDVFRSLYITNDEIVDYQISNFGSELKVGSNETEDIKQLIPQIMGDEKYTDYVGNKKLTAKGVSLLNDYCAGKLVEAKKQQLHALINHSELARLTVDSGEIIAKLELSCLNETIVDDTSNAKTTKSVPIDKTKEVVADKSKVTIRPLKVSDILIDKASGIHAKEVVDEETGTKTILIDRKSVLASGILKSDIPTARIVAKPATSTSTSTSTNLFSQVTIKFKTI